MIFKKITTLMSALLFSITLYAAEGHNHSASHINVNNATVEQLDELIGVGEITARAIVEYRQMNGPFKSTEDLMNVRRVGEAVIEKNKDRIVFE